MFLAAIVVIDHFGVFLKPFGLGAVSAHSRLGMNGGFAVTFFFVISGFLISYVLSRKYSGKPNGTAKFYQSRFVRIFSLYWPVLIMLVIISPAARAAFYSHQPVDIFSHIFLVGTDFLLALKAYPDPYHGANIFGLAQAWALGSELAFYILAPFLLRSWVVALFVLLASISFRLWLVDPTHYDALLRYHFLGSTICFFLLGHFARLLADRLIWLWSGRSGSAFLAIAVITLAVPLYGRPIWDSPGYWLSILAFALSLPGIFTATKDVGWMNALGDWSYGVYLIHIAPMTLAIQSPVIMAWFKDSAPHIPWAAYVLSYGYLLAIAILAAFIHRFIEKPVAIGMRALFGRIGRSTRHAETTQSSQ